MPATGKAVCQFCRLKVEPANPYRVERDGKVVHSYCVLEKGRQKAIIAAVVAFLATHTEMFTAKKFKDNAAAIKDPRKLGEAIVTALHEVLDRPHVNTTWRNRRVLSFAEKIGNRLFCDMRIASAVRSNGKT